MLIDSGKEETPFFQLSIHCEVQDFQTMQSWLIQLITKQSNRHFDGFVGTKGKDIRDGEVRARVTGMHCIICETV